MKRWGVISQSLFIQRNKIIKNIVPERKNQAFFLIFDCKNKYQNIMNDKPKTIKYHKFEISIFLKKACKIIGKKIIKFT